MNTIITIILIAITGVVLAICYDILKYKYLRSKIKPSIDNSKLKKHFAICSSCGLNKQIVNDKSKRSNPYETLKLLCRVCYDKKQEERSKW